MEKAKSNKIVIALLIIIILILLTLVILFMTGTISIKTNIVNDEANNNKYADEKVDIQILSMDEPTIYIESPNSNLWIHGKMNLSFNEEKYFAVLLSGYCIGENNEKYKIHGPGSGQIGFHNGETEYILANSISSSDDVLYADGTSQSSLYIDWSNVKIKSCNIEKLTTISQGFDNDVAEKEITLNFEKTFK